ncbi:MinD/ParA family protein [Helicobacter jaachi]|uniref:MinD/ParA family protein n=1 Tax=Helicobacter jaachi TaxID=1677920 RepID=A0A4U8T6D1_9HELI|nr:MinD/ParA family protein [Helicobacter jaachi]TLD95105.1 MinD/ParA family protein [Helicobacter jaachi]
MIQNQAHELQSLMQSQDKRNFSQTKFVAITSGKGGVGKSSISANLAYCLWKLKKRVAVFDADIGLANLDLIFGVKTKKNILHALRGEASFQEIIYPIEDGLYLIPGDNGEEILKYANSGVFERFLQESDILNTIDYMIIDTGAGIGGITQSFLNASDMLVVVTMPDPSALTDAYATIKLNAKVRKDIFMILNMVKNARESEVVFERVVNLAKKNIPELNLCLLGFIEQSQAVAKAVRSRELFVKAEPFTAASGQIGHIAKQLVAKMEQNMLSLPQKQGFADFLRKVLGYI